MGRFRLNTNLIISGLTLLLLFYGCNFNGDHVDEIKEVDLFDSPDALPDTVNDSGIVLKVAVSAIISPRETYMYYHDLFNYISGKLGYKIEFIHRKTYEEINLMIEKNEVSLAFICSGAYVLGNDKSGFEILAVPVCNGETSYKAFIIVNKSSGIRNFEELKGRRFAFTDLMSNTGKYNVIQRVNELGHSPENFFSAVVYSHAHDVSIQLVSKGIVDGATISSLVYKYSERFYPERVSNIRIIEESKPFGAPPVVLPNNTDEKLRTGLKNILLDMHMDSTGNRILNRLLIDKFVDGHDSSYNSIRELYDIGR